MRTTTDLLIVGAGPFGLSLAAMARHLGLDHLVVGTPMGFWRDNMPGGMLLRSGDDWHLDPAGDATLERFLAERGRPAGSKAPITRDEYLAYGAWFQAEKGIEPLEATVMSLQRDGDGFLATLDDGNEVDARSVALALGFAYFAAVPTEYASFVPAARLGHTSERVDMARYGGRRVLIVGGRQSAFEWTALLLEAGAASVDVVHRHPTPAFAESDWTWVSPLMDETMANPGWFAGLPEAEQETYRKRLYNEGRLKLEPWLAARIDSPNVRLWPGATIAGCDENGDGLAVRLAPDGSVNVDDVLLATGYAVDVARIPFLDPALLAEIETANGFPILDAGFQSTVPGLYFTSIAASRTFGPFFGFTVSCRASAHVLGHAVASQLAHR